ncbi:MAG: response regulator [Deltaproteobacteria bacterium]|nr:response regulator [Deltaproteobacteria bacterium]
MPSQKLTKLKIAPAEIRLDAFLQKIYLPAIQTELDLEAPTFETAIGGGAKTVLLVDDDDNIRDLAATLLMEFGYKIITADNGKEALEIYRIEKDRISLILLDLIMPVMDGGQCLAEILRINPKAKVIVASGYSQSGPANDAMAGGAKGFVQKPYNMRQLLTAIRQVLDNDLPGPVNADDGCQ